MRTCKEGLSGRLAVSSLIFSFRFVKVLNAPGCEAAKNFYIHYLRKNGYYDRLVTVFQLSGMKNEEALMRLYIAYHLPNVRAHRYV